MRSFHARPLLRADACFAEKRLLRSAQWDGSTDRAYRLPRAPLPRFSSACDDNAVLASVSQAAFPGSSTPCTVHGAVGVLIAAKLDMR